MTEAELDQTLEALKRIDVQLASLNATRGLLRETIADHIGRPATKLSVEHSGLAICWQPASTTAKLDRGLLVRAGVTPEQLEKGTKKGTKAAFLTIRKAGEPEPGE